MWTPRAAREKEAVGTRAARAAERATVVSMDIVNSELWGRGTAGGGEARLIAVALKSTSSCGTVHVQLLRLDDEPSLASWAVSELSVLDFALSASRALSSVSL